MTTSIHKNALYVALLSLVVITVVALIGYGIAQDVQEAKAPVVADTIGDRATTTPEVKEEAKEKPTYTPPAQTYTPPTNNTHIEINNIKNENTGTTNNETSTVQPRNEPVTEPAQTAPQFIEPRKLTPTEIGEDLLTLYNLTGTVEHLDNGKLRVTLSTGQQVVQDLVGGWEEKLKLILNRIK